MFDDDQRSSRQSVATGRRGFLRSVGAVTAGLASSVSVERAQAKQPTTGRSLYTPPATTPKPGAMYPRVTRLSHDHSGGSVLLATFEQYRSTMDEHAEKPYFPVFRSKNGGRTWRKISEIHDTETSWGLRYQPTLFALPRATGPWDAGTVLAAGNLVPDDLSGTQIVLYASEDHGRTWEYVSTVATGGRAVPTDGADPVWEPELELDAAGNLVCYFSDERHKEQGYDQLVTHKRSLDGGLTWEPQTFDVALADGVPGRRPGMPVVQRLPTGTYVMTYEIVRHRHGAVYIRTSPDGLDWGDPTAMGTPVATPDGRYLANGPYVTWTSRGSNGGTLLVSGKTLRNPDGSPAPGSGSTMLAASAPTAEWAAVQSPLHYDDEIETGDIYVGWTSPLVPVHNHVLEMTSTYLPDRDLCEIRHAKRPLPQLESEQPPW